MAELVLVTGGARSGKSRWAQQRAESLPGPRFFLATCAPSVDHEMADRIARHQRDRADRGWATVEEPLELAGALARMPGGTVMVDCLTIWIANLMHTGRKLDEDRMAALARELLSVIEPRAGTVLLVTNEVGLGVVPPTEMGRQFRDLAGRCHQVLAAAADEVVLMVCGLPLYVKSTKGTP